LSSLASVSRQAASGVSVPGPGRWLTVTFSVALLWIFGFATEARAELAAVADTNTTADVASLDAGGDSIGTVAEETPATTDASSATEPVDTSSGTEPADPTPTAEPTDPTPATDPDATAPPAEPAPITPVTDPTPTTDPAATAPPIEPAPAPDPITPVIEPTTEPPLETPPPPVSPEPARPGLKSSIVVIDELPASYLLSSSQGTTLDALIGISRNVTDRASQLARAPENPGNGRPAPAAPDLPQLPAPHHPSAPANPAPGGVGGTGSSALGVLAALFALAFAGLLGEVLPVSVAALRPPDLAFHLKRPG